MSIKQLSVFLENKPGALQQLTRVLAASEVDMKGLSLSEMTDFGIVRLIVKDTITAANVLREAGFVSSINPVLAYEIPNEPGGLNRLLELLTGSGINVEYMYSCATGKGSNACLVFRVSDIKAAELALSAKGLQPITHDDL